MGWGIVYNLDKYKLKVGAVVLFLSILTIITYMSGPVLNATVTSDEAEAMSYVWQEIKDQPDNYCVFN